MHIGIQLASLGRQADPAGIGSAARTVEAAGHAAIWVGDGLLASCHPGHPRLDGCGDAPPPRQVASFDPLVTLAFAAACTGRIRLGTSALVAPWYRPVTLARSLAALDVVSGGRLTVGLGVAASTEEYGALGVPRRHLAERQDELLEVLEAVWPSQPAEAHRDVERRSVRGPESRQVPRPPVLLATCTAGGLDRVARRADGWLAVGVPVDALHPLWTTVRDRAALHGRDPATLQLVVCADVDLCAEAVGGRRAPYHGDLDQVVDDLVATERAGAHEVVLSLRQDLAFAEVMATCERLVEALASHPQVAA